MRQNKSQERRSALKHSTTNVHSKERIKKPKLIISFPSFPSKTSTTHTQHHNTSYQSATTSPKSESGFAHLAGTRTMSASVMEYEFSREIRAVYAHTKTAVAWRAVRGLSLGKDDVCACVRDVFWEGKPCPGVCQRQHNLRLRCSASTQITPFSWRLQQTAQHIFEVVSPEKGMVPALKCNASAS